MRSWLHVAVAAICVRCVLGNLLCSSAPQQSLSFFTASTTSAGSGPPAIGVNAGHNFDPSWVAWLQRLGVSGLRIFGLSGGFGTLQGFATDGLSPQDFKATWGNDLNNNQVTNQATFNTAVSAIRTPSGHTPGAYSWPNPPRWASHELLLNSTTIAPDGNSMLNTVAAAQSIGVEPLLVFWMGCGVFSFSTLDPSNSTYWAERWELYKHQYIGARWAFNHGVRKLEFWNEPDLNSDCITAYSWLEHYTLQSQAIQNAYADLNADVAASRIQCPVASCPFRPIILASAFAQDTYVQGPSSASSSYRPLANGLWPSFYTDDSYVYMGEETVLNEHTAFPPWSTTSRSGMVLASGQLNQASVQNMNAFSFHSYGKYGFALATAGLNDAAYIAGNRTSTAMSIGSAQATMPVATTEHAAHTTAAWNALSSTQDNNYESSRLASQILYMAKNGFETYIFKFSTLEQSNAITAGCTKFLWPPGTPAQNLPAGSKISGSSTCGSGSTLCTPCGAQKTGIFWGENLNYPYPVGDSSLSAEAARLIINAMVGGGGSKRLEAIAGGFTNNPWCNYTASVPGYMDLPVAVVNDGMRRTLLWVNEGYNPQDSIPGSSTVTLSGSAYQYYPALQSVQMNVTFNISAWSVSSGATIVHNLVAAGYNGEVSGAIIAGQSSGSVVGSTVVGGLYSTITILVPAYSTSAIVAPVGPQTETLLSAADRTTLYPSRSSASSSTVSTSITSDHTNTAISLSKFTLTGGSVLTAILELVVSAAPTSDMLMTVIGSSGSWSSATATWQSVTQITNGTAPSGVILSPAQNFVRLDNGNAVAGHVTVPAGTAVGTIRRVDVTEYVRSVGTGSATFVIARRMRNGPFFGNSGGPIAADTLSGGATVSFSSTSLRIMFGQSAPPPPPNMWGVTSATPPLPSPPPIAVSASPPPPPGVSASSPPPPPGVSASPPPPPPGVSASPPSPPGVSSSPPPALATSPPPSSSWLAVDVNGTAVWQVPQGVGTTWTSAITSPFSISDPTMISFVSRGGSSISCFEDVRIVPLVAPPPLMLATRQWYANVTLGGVSNMPSGIGAAISTFVGVPTVSVMPSYSNYGDVTAAFTISATNPMQRASIAAALVSSGGSSSSTSSDTSPLWPAPNLGPALTAFLQSRSGFSQITFADISGLVETFVTTPIPPPAAMPPHPAYPPLPPASPVTWPLGNTIGCPLSGGNSLVSPFRGALIDLQVYDYAIAHACALSLANNATTGCITPPPSPPAAPPSPPSPPSPPPAVAIVASDTSLLAQRCGVMSYGTAMIGLGACVYRSSTVVSVTSVALGRTTFTGTGAPNTTTLFGLSPGSSIDVAFLKSTGVYTISWRMTMQSPSVTPTLLTVSVGGKTLYASSVPSGSVCSFTPANACATNIQYGSKITFSLTAGASIAFIDSIAVSPGTVSLSCIAVAPPVQPSPPYSPPHPPVAALPSPPPLNNRSPPPGAAAAGSFVMRPLNTLGVISATAPYSLPTSGAFLGKKFALQFSPPIPGAAVNVMLSVLVMSSDVYRPEEIYTASRPVIRDTFCGLQAVGATAYLLDDPSAVSNLLSGPSLPFEFGSYGIANAISKLTTISIGKQLNVGGLVTTSGSDSAWLTSAYDGASLFMDFQNASFVGKTVRVCAIIKVTPPASGRRLLTVAPTITIIDSGTIPLSLPPSPPPPPPPPIAYNYDANGNPIAASPPSPPPPTYRGFMSPPPSPPGPPPSPNPPPSKQPTPPNPPPSPSTQIVTLNVSSMTFHSTNSSASVYGNNAFRSPQAVVSAAVNQSHVIVTITHYSEVIGDTPGAFNYGRSEFTYATFNPLVAAAAIWQANSQTPIGNAFDLVASKDAYLYMGGCNLSAVAGSVSSITDAADHDWQPGMETSSLTDITIQAAGCTNPVAVVMPDGTFQRTSVPGPSTYWSSAAPAHFGRRRLVQAPTTSWAFRQTTCGADDTDVCSVTRPFAFMPAVGSTDTVPCTLRTQGVLILPMQEFLTSGIATETTPAGGSSTRSFTWTVSTVEVVSSSAVNATSGINVFEWMVAHNAFSLFISQAGAVVETLAVGKVSPPMFLSVVSAYGISGGPSSQRLMSDGRVRMIWQTNAYVQQRNAYASGAPTAPDTLLDITRMAGTQYFPTWVAAGGFTSQCNAWQPAADGDVMPPGEDSTIACNLPGCMPISQNLLPSSLFIGITKSATLQPLYWVQYVMKIVCYITPPSGLDATMDIVLPNTFVEVPYALLSSPGGGLLTDITTPPFSQFAVETATITATMNGSVSVPMDMRLVILPETLISLSETLNDLFASPDDLVPIDGNLEYSQAFALTVQVSDVNARLAWRVRPDLIIMAAHLNAPPPAMSIPISESSPLNASFCGLDSTDLVSAWAIADASAVGDFPSEPDALIDPAVWIAGGGSSSVFNTTAALTPDLSASLLDIITRNRFSSIGAMQGDLIPAAFRGRGIGVAVVPDSSGGFGVPARNRFFLGSSSIAGYAVSFCAITFVQAYQQLRVANTFPVYTDQAAALRDTAVVNGVMPQPIAVLGIDLGVNDAFRYYVPANPVSSAGRVCTDMPAAFPTIQTTVNTDPACGALMTATPPGRRHLMATQSSHPLSKNMFAEAPAGPRKTAGSRPVIFATSPGSPPPIPGLPLMPPPLADSDARSAGSNSTNITNTAPSKDDGLGTPAIVGIALAVAIPSLCVAAFFIIRALRKNGVPVQQKQAFVGARRGHVKLKM